MNFLLVLAEKAKVKYVHNDVEAAHEHTKSRKSSRSRRSCEKDISDREMMQALGGEVPASSPPSAVKQKVEEGSSGKQDKQKAGVRSTERTQPKSSAGRKFLY